MKKPKAKLTFFDENGNEIDGELVDLNSLYKEQDDLYRAQRKKIEQDEIEKLNQWLASRSGVYTTNEDWKISTAASDKYTVIKDIFFNVHYISSSQITMIYGTCDDK